MKSIIIKRNKLCNNSIELRSAKFNNTLSREKVSELIKEQDKVYKQFEFYKEFIKAYEKEKNKKWKFIY